MTGNFVSNVLDIHCDFTGRSIIQFIVTRVEVSCDRKMIETRIPTFLSSYYESLLLLHFGRYPIESDLTCRLRLPFQGIKDNTVRIDDVHFPSFFRCTFSNIGTRKPYGHIRCDRILVNCCRFQSSLPFTGQLNATFQENIVRTNIVNFRG